jgi:dipeptidase E
MHLYLSSYHIGHEPHRLASMVRSPRALIVANALDNVGDQRTAFVHSQARALASLGIAAEELDLRGYFAAPGGFERRLDGVGLVWVTGGNAFLLRRAMLQSGFDAYLVRRRYDDDLVYGGFSAGACVAGPTLRGLERVDAVDATAAGYADGLVWEGLDLVPYSIAPHYRSAHGESSAVESMVAYWIDHKLPFVALRDGDVIIADAGAYAPRAGRRRG